MKFVFFEVESDLSPPSHCLVDGTPSPKIIKKARLKEMEVRLDPNFMADLPDEFICHSTKLVLCEESSSSSPFLY